MQNMKSNPVFFGYSDKLMYDPSSYQSWKMESTGPMYNKLAEYSRYHPGECLPKDVGLNADIMGNNGGTLVGHAVAKSQQLVDLESILSNRNFKASKDKKGHVNPINPITDMKIIPQNDCDFNILPEYSRLSDPLINYTEMSINRFYDLGANPQPNFKYPFIVNTNTSLEITDRYKKFIRAHRGLKN